MSTVDHDYASDVTTAESQAAMKLLSPRRKSSEAHTPFDLAVEQLEHFGIEADSDFGRALLQTAEHLYRTQGSVDDLARAAADSFASLDRSDRVAYFNAKKFLSFQIAKVLDTVQTPFRKAYQSLGYTDGSLYAKGPYPIFDNVTALFSANPVVVRTATYVYACTEWVDDAFHGKEPTHEIYTRLLNPTSIALANHIVDLEAGSEADQYLAWNFNSGMAAIDAIFSHLLKRDDVVVASRNVYGGTYQLLHDHYAKSDRMGVALEWFDGYDGPTFEAFLDVVEAKHRERLDAGKSLLVYLESPCNPHGYVMDLPAICSAAHARGHRVVLDSTVATPVLSKPLQREEVLERPDFVIHSYTKDLAGTGAATAGVVIGRNEDMFVPKGESAGGISWDETLFWNVYYIKGAFLESDKAFEVLTGMKTVELRILRKCINTRVLARFLDRHPSINVICNALESDPNYSIAQRTLALGLSAPLFTIDLEGAGIPRADFVRFFDSLSPTFGHQVSLGQSNTVVLCPAMTSHSEMDEAALAKAGIAPTTIRMSIGDENPKELIAHFLASAKLALEPVSPGFMAHFPSDEEIDQIARDEYLTVHQRLIDSGPSMEDLK